MPKHFTELTLFISCPSDVNELRGIAEAAARDISDALRTTKGMSLNVISWNKHVVPGISTDPPQVVNAQTIGNYDIYLGILAGRFGTPTPRAGSGTEEEFNLALEAFSQDSTSIRVLMYFQAFGGNPLSIDPDQLRCVQNFRKKLGEKGVLYKELTDLDDALISIKAHLLKLISEEWDMSSDSWIDVAPSTNSEKHIIPEDVQAALSGAAIVASVDSQMEELKELGLFDKYAIGTNALNASGQAIAEIGAALNVLTARSSSHTDAIANNGDKGIQGLQEACNLYAIDMDTFVAQSRTAILSAKFNLLRGAEYLEAFYKEAALVGFRTPESANELAQSINETEPSLRGFRDSIQAGKQATLQLAPYTAKFRIARDNVVAFLKN